MYLILSLIYSTAKLLLQTKLELFPTSYSLRFWLPASSFNLGLRKLQLSPDVYLLWQQGRVRLFVLCSLLYNICLCYVNRLVRLDESCNFLLSWLEKAPTTLKKLQPISSTSSSFCDNSWAEV